MPDPEPTRPRPAARRGGQRPPRARGQAGRRAGRPSVTLHVASTNVARALTSWSHTAVHDMAPGAEFRFRREPLYLFIFIMVKCTKPEIHPVHRF